MFNVAFNPESPKLSSVLIDTPVEISKNVSK